MPLLSKDFLIEEENIQLSSWSLGPPGHPLQLVIENKEAKGQRKGNESSCQVCVKTTVAAVCLSCRSVIIHFRSVRKLLGEEECSAASEKMSAHFI